MFDLFKKKQDILPVKVEKEQEPLVPLISDPEELKKKKAELCAMVKSAAEDGKISSFEYHEMHDLAMQVGVSDAEIEDMVRDEFRGQLKQQIILFAKDGKVDEEELTAIMHRAKEIGMTKGEVELLINEALSKQEEKDAKQFKKVVGIALGMAFAAAGVAGAILHEMAKQGNLKHTTVHHTKD